MAGTLSRTCCQSLAPSSCGSYLCLRGSTGCGWRHSEASLEALFCIPLEKEGAGLGFRNWQSETWSLRMSEAAVYSGSCLMKAAGIPWGTEWCTSCALALKMSSTCPWSCTGRSSMWHSASFLFFESSAFATHVYVDPKKKRKKWNLFF